MPDLIKSRSLDTWNLYLSAYPRALQARKLEVSSRSKQGKSYNGDTLIEEDEWLWNTLPDIVKSREPMHMTQEELSKLLHWKLTRGEWRIGLQSKADSNPDSKVKAATTRCMALLANEPDLDDILDAVNQLSKNGQPDSLQGIGPVAASVLGTVCTQVPYLSDELITATNHPLKYTIADCKRVITFVHKLVQSLNAKGIPFTAKEVEKALFAEQVEKRGRIRVLAEGKEGGKGHEEGGEDTDDDSTNKTTSDDEDEAKVEKKRGKKKQASSDTRKKSRK
ncbi:hypothetical protein SmJEL517_g06228 [Synchytrium microbalum]|uniref:Uncharacterized protein n=1 Tax=Synchytrium microbalum TaxID=1806994 RepID=A0A507BGL1_9FUNG|nr:uncharacterized protein SmJEL517_g06228 [Synchytrium microbalum]TPX30140.1 hypothetical protein SmJEL517_g06228 [Synchytrium microbalum]